MAELKSNSTAVVNVGLNAKVNLGNFESVGVNISVTDSAREGENVQQAFDRIYAFVETRLNEKIEEVRNLGEAD